MTRHAIPDLNPFPLFEGDLFDTPDTTVAPEWPTTDEDDWPTSDPDAPANRWFATHTTEEHA